ncbi:MAG: hypothetical protein ACOVRN_14430 [Flavobacterium sp.]
MKKIVYAFALLTGCFMASCSGDDNNNPGTGNAANYLPETNGNYWVYNTTLDGTSSGRDSLYVKGDTTITSIAYKKFKTKDVATGFFCGALSNNGVRTSGSRLLVTGSASLAFSADLPLNVSITDFPFLDAAATAGTQVGTTSGTISQDSGSGYTIVANYTLKSIADQSLTTFTAPNNATYSNVKTMKMVLNLKITANVDLGNGTIIPISIMTAQDVLTSTQYYAENIGNIYTNTVINYQLADFSSLGADLPIPQTGSYTQTEVLVNHNVN